MNWDSYKNHMDMAEPSLGEAVAARKAMADAKATVASIAEARVKIRRERRLAYQAEERRLQDQFKADALAELGLTGHPKADLLFSLAWDEGHSSGFQEVFGHMERMADLVRP